VLTAGERAAIAREVVGAFVERVHRASSFDPRPEARTGDPMEWHRHRIHPLLWKALEAPGTDPNDPIQQERGIWLARQRHYRGRRPIWSQLKDSRAPWHARQDE